jgi:uncharacterized protein HemX
MSPETQSIDITGIAVALGRIEEKVSHLMPMDERLRKVETDVAEMKAKDAPKAPWWAVVGGIAGIGSIVLTAIAVFTIIVKTIP